MTAMFHELEAIQKAIECKQMNSAGEVETEEEDAAEDNFQRVINDMLQVKAVSSLYSVVEHGNPVPSMMCPLSVSVQSGHAGCPRGAKCHGI